MHEWLAPLVVAAGAALVAWLVASHAMRRAPEPLVRQNVDDRAVPAVLGFGIVAGAVAAVAIYALWDILLWHGAECPFDRANITGGGVRVCLQLSFPPWELVWVTLVPIIGMFAAGLWDDFRGDERPRGFGGHLGALRGGAITGGLVKMGVGVVVSVATAGLYLRAISLDVLFAAVVIALAANLLNLLDRAPGRAIKVFLFVSAITIVISSGTVHLLAGCIGAALGLLSSDLTARGMLGDAGANLLGAVMGLGLVATVHQRLGWGNGQTLALVLIVAVLLSLNLLSEKVSFSRVIEETPWLARLDHLGRK
jgi:hypothetical protein